MTLTKLLFFFHMTFHTISVGFNFFFFYVVAVYVNVYSVLYFPISLITYYWNSFTFGLQSYF